jgi:hypothetical protein
VSKVFSEPRRKPCVIFYFDLLLLLDVRIAYPRDSFNFFVSKKFAVSLHRLTLAPSGSSFKHSSSDRNRFHNRFHLSNIRVKVGGSKMESAGW